MKQIRVDKKFEASCTVENDFGFGEVFHTQRNRHGGAVLTPIARFYISRPVHPDGFNPHWRLDCFVRKDHKLSPDPEYIGRQLLSALIANEVCDEPVWLSWHLSEEVGGNDFGDVFEEF